VANASIANISDCDFRDISKLRLFFFFFFFFLFFGFFHSLIGRSLRNAVKLLRVFEYGASGTTGERSYWTIKVEENQTAAEVADTVATKCALLAGSFALFEVTVDGKNERRLGDHERPLDVMREWSADARKIFAVKKSTIVRFVDHDETTAETYVTMDLVDKQGHSKTVAQALDFIARKRLVKEPLYLLEVELSYVGRTLRALAPADSLMVIRRKWDATASTSFAYTRNPNATNDELWRRQGSQQLAIHEATAPLKSSNADVRARLRGVVECECIDWIERVLGSRFPDGTSLWFILRDRAGANFVALLNALKPNAIPHARLVAGTSDLALLKNLDLVCDALARFGLAKKDIMQSNDVVECHSNVLYTLFVLAFQAHRRGHREKWSSLATAGFFVESDAGDANKHGEQHSATTAVDEAQRAADALAAARAQVSASLPRDLDIAHVVKASDELGVPLIHAAIKLDDIESLRYLLFHELNEAAAHANTANGRGQSPLHWAANLCRVGAIETLLLAGAIVDVQDVHGATPLHLAAARRSPECIRALCDAGANPLALSALGITPLFAACDNPNDDAAPLNAMLASCAARDSPIDIDRPCRDGQTSLHAAAREGRERILTRLLAANASLRLRSGGDTPLLLAAKIGSVSTCELLLAEGKRREGKIQDLTYCMLSDQDDDGNTALHAAVAMGFVPVVRLLLRFEAPLDVTNNAGLTPSGVAEHEQLFDLVPLLGGGDAPPSALPVPPGEPDDDEDDDEIAPPPPPPPHQAAPQPAIPAPMLPGPPKVPPPPHVAAAAAATAAATTTSTTSTASTPTNDSTDLLFEAAKRGDADEVKRLVTDLGVSVDAKDRNRNTALHHASREGHVAVIKQLQRHKAKLTSQNRSKETALHLAAQAGHADAARALLKVLKPEKQGVLLEAKCERTHQTALHYAMQSARSGTATLDVLLACEQIVLSARDANDNTPLHIGAEFGNTDAVAALLVRAAVPPPPDAKSLIDIEAANRDGNTAMHVACARGHVNIVRRLAFVGANKNARNAAQQTPLHLAVAGDRDEVVAALVVLKADLSAVDQNGETARALATRLGHKHCAALLGA
jgi:ankyrin repeat protein